MLKLHLITLFLLITTLLPTPAKADWTNLIDPLFVSQMDQDAAEVKNNSKNNPGFRAEGQVGVMNGSAISGVKIGLNLPGENDFELVLRGGSAYLEFRMTGEMIPVTVATSVHAKRESGIGLLSIQIGIPFDRTMIGNQDFKGASSSMLSRLLVTPEVIVQLMEAFSWDTSAGGGKGFVTLNLRGGAGAGQIADFDNEVTTLVTTVGFDLESVIIGNNGRGIKLKAGSKFYNDTARLTDKFESGRKDFIELQLRQKRADNRLGNKWLSLSGEHSRFDVLPDGEAESTSNGSVYFIGIGAGVSF